MDRPCSHELRLEEVTMRPCSHGLPLVEVTIRPCSHGLPLVEVTIRPCSRELTLEEVTIRPCSRELRPVEAQTIQLCSRARLRNGKAVLLLSPVRRPAERASERFNQREIGRASCRERGEVA